eukprot:m.723398 g.723398  ORF g.723398 m.723398 type:complete len:865 (+) comp23021_c0_seq4:58-2652(+)
MHKSQQRTFAPLLFPLPLLSHINNVLKNIDMMLFYVILLLVSITSSHEIAVPELSFSTGFASNAVFQRGITGTAIYGFALTNTSVKVQVSETPEHYSSAAESDVLQQYSVDADVKPWSDTTGCNATKCVYPSTQPMPPHGSFYWRALLHPQTAPGGNFTIVVSTGSGYSINITNVTFGDVYFCSGQSNMALELYYTFSVDELKAEMMAGKYSQIRTFEYGFMNGRIEAPNPQWVTTWDDTQTWNKVSESSHQPSGPEGSCHSHSSWARFSATCMYFGAELINAKEQLGLDADVPIGLMQSAIGGTMIEEWMSNSSLSQCSNLSQSSGNSALYHAMVAPFVNYSVAGWLWYQGENNCGGFMGNANDGSGYGCALPTMINSWRAQWHRTTAGEADTRLFGIATLAAGGSEGNDNHMAGMRWSQTANFGRWTDNPFLPNTFGAQVYDLGDPWAHTGDGNRRVMNETACDLGTCRPTLDDHGRQILNCCWLGPKGCPDPSNPSNFLKPCVDSYNCSLPEPTSGKYGATCATWTENDFLPEMRTVARCVRDNSPSGIPANNFMGSIHPRLKRPVGRRLAYACARILKERLEQRESGDNGGVTTDSLATSGAYTGPTIAGCKDSADRTLVLAFNATLLGGEGLLFRDWDANTTGGWTANPYNDSAAKYHPYPKIQLQPTMDSLGLMVCTAGADVVGNASTCACQAWDWVSHNSTNATTGEVTLQTFWYCQDGPGWKPTAADRTNRSRRWVNRSGGGYWQRVLPSPDVPPYHLQWKPLPLVRPNATQASNEVMVNVSTLHGQPPLAVRLAWPLFKGGDTGCPNRMVQDGHGICMPGSSPLYTSLSNLPANPFFAVIRSGSCHCTWPQTCSD